MLYHHDSRDYQVAASSAADHARTKLEGLIQKGRTRARHVIDMVNTDVPSDYIVLGSSMNFERDDGHVLLGFKDQQGEDLLVGLHRNALQQACNRVELPKSWVDKKLVGEPWERDLLIHNLNESFHHLGKRNLVRVVDFEARGILSNKFRRMDSRPIIDAFGLACQKYDAVPIEGYYMQTRIALKALLPVVFEPVENEIVAIGIVLQNSDYGHGALSVRLIILRLWCTNYAIGEECLRQVHLGKRLDDNIEFSQQTYELDTKTMVSAIEDIVTSSLHPNSVHRLLNGIVAANEQEVSSAQITNFLKKYLNKDERKEVVDAFNSPDVVNLPPGQTAYRLSNAISWIAGKAEDESRRLEMQQVAGRLIEVPADA